MAPTKQLLFPRLSKIAKPIKEVLLLGTTIAGIVIGGDYIRKEVNRHAMVRTDNILRVERIADTDKERDKAISVINEAVEVTQYGYIAGFLTGVFGFVLLDYVLTKILNTQLTKEINEQTRKN